MNKAELIEALAQRSGLQKQKAKKLLEAYVDIVTEAMSHNEEIVLIGFGTLIPRPQTERLARNPKTGTPVMIPARTTVKFKPGKYLLDAINKPEERSKTFYLTKGGNLKKVAFFLRPVQIMSNFGAGKMTIQS